MEHISILLIELSKNVEKNEIIFYDKIKNLFLSKNKKSYYLIKQIYNATEDNRLKRIIINDYLQNIDNNQDIKYLLIDLLLPEKDSNKKMEILNDISDNIEKIIVLHINEESYNNFIDNIKDFLKISNINKVIQHIIDIFFHVENYSISKYNLLYKLKSFVKIYIKKQKEENNIDIKSIEELYNKISLLFEKIQIIKPDNNLEDKNNVLNCLKALFKYCSIDFRTKIINKYIISKLNKKDENIYSDINIESLISMLINYVLKNNEILIKEKIISDSFNDLLISKIFNELNSMNFERKKVFEQSKLFKIKNMPENSRDKLLVNIKKYYSSKNVENNLFLNLSMNIYNSLSLQEQTQNLDILFVLLILNLFHKNIYIKLWNSVFELVIYFSINSGICQINSSLCNSPIISP